jgi:CNT family concentrative nucleoside transporter
MIVFQSLLGIAIFTGLIFSLSESKNKIPLRTILIGIGLQFAFALMLLKIPIIQDIFAILNAGISLLQKVTEKAAIFMFGYLAGGEPPFAALEGRSDFIVAFRVLPLVIVISAFSSILVYLRVLPIIIRAISLFLSKTMRLSAPLAFGAGASLFLGTIETPLIIRPYLEKMSRGDLLALLCCSMSTISGAVLALYSSVLAQVLPNPTEHLVTASVISIPAALMLSAIMIPRTTPLDKQETSIRLGFESSRSVMDALIKGTQDGVTMVISIIAIIMVMFSLIYLVDELLLCIPLSWGISPIADIMSYLFAPFMWLVGISWEHSFSAARLMGTKVVLNEFVAFLELAKQTNSFSAHEKTILTYVFCNFANFASLGIIVGGLSSILPTRRQELITLGWKSLIIGNVASMMTACVVAILAFI